MSNQKPNQNAKVISLKKLSDIQKGQKDYMTTNMDEQHTKVKNEVLKLEASLKDLQKKKENMMMDLKTAIDKEKTAWLETKEQERLVAKETGYKVGYDEGLEKAEQTWADKIREANQTIEIANRDYYRTVEKHQDAILQLAIAAAEKVLKDKLKENEAYFLSIIKHAMNELKDKSNIVIYVHPSKFTFLMEQKIELEQLLEKEDLLSIYMDKQLKNEDCLIKHPFGQVEVGIDVQLEQIKNTLTETLAGES